MPISAGQSADRDSVGVDDGFTPAQEAAFWARVRREFPLEFGGVDARALSAEPPSPDLLAQLMGAAVHDEDLVGDDALVEVVAAWQRVAALAHAGATRAAAALSRRACVQVPGEAVPVGPGRRRLTAVRATGIEIAIRTGCTVRAGELLARDGRLFDGVLADTGAALASGQIDARKARQIADRLADVALQTALLVQDAVLPGAGRRSPGQVDQDLTRALVAVEPDEAERRHERARDTRRVCHPRLLPDGMAGMWAVLPAEDATRLDATLDAAARAARAAGDPRTTDQLRADGLVDLVTGHPTWPTTASTHGPASPVGATAPTGPDLPGLPGRAGARRSGPPVRRPSVPVHVDVTVSLDTLLGLDQAPGELTGYGAITATQARALAAGGLWRRLVTDPLSGAVLDVGRTRYRPPPALREHVIARDRTCARPGCTVPADRTDLDHTIAFHGTRHGPTADHNLAPLCATDHTAKTLGLLHLEQPEPGILVWTTATGQRVQVIPGSNGQITPLPHPTTATAGAGTGTGTAARTGFTTTTTTDTSGAPRPTDHAPDRSEAARAAGPPEGAATPRAQPDAPPATS